MKIIDISVSVDDKTPIWPKITGPKFEKIYSIERGDAVNDTKIEMSVHTGTHIDAPLHFISDGKSVDQILLETCVGPAYVAFLPDVKSISAADLNDLNLPTETTRILFRTSNSLLWKRGETQFQKNYVGLTTDAASWLVGQGIKLVGVDYLSVAKFNEAEEVHRILLGKEVVLLEGINLDGVELGVYQLSCLPVKLLGLEAAPVRAVLTK